MRLDKGTPSLKGIGFCSYVQNPCPALRLPRSEELRQGKTSLR
jgi:hypothetical protein